MVIDGRARYVGLATIVTMNDRDFAGPSDTYGLRILKPGDLAAELREEEP